MVPSASHAAAKSGWPRPAVHDRYAHAFSRACAGQAGHVTEQTFTVGGRPVAARIAGPALARTFARAMLPGPTVGREGAALRLDLWDEGATGVPAPVRADDDPYPDRGESGERFMLAPGGAHGRLSSPDFEIHLDRDATHVVGWIRATDTLAYWHRARPLRTLLTPWLADRGCIVLHAAMVARPGAGIVLAAPSLSGKSTCAAACGAAGFDVLGDDTVALEQRGDELVGHAVHAAVKLRRDGLERHGELSARVAAAGMPWADDAVAYVDELFPGRLVPTARVAAIAFPRLGPSPQTTFERLGGAAALRALVGCILRVDPRDLSRGFDAAPAMLDRVAVYRVTVGQDASAIPSAFDALLADAAG